MIKEYLWEKLFSVVRWKIESKIIVSLLVLIFISELLDSVFTGVLVLFFVITILCGIIRDDYERWRKKHGSSD